MLRLEDIRTIVKNNMPYDSGFMFLSGAQFFETEHFFMVEYDTYRVPYIVWQEMGFTHWISKEQVTVNKGFIKDRTLGALNRFASYQDAGIQANVISPYEEENNRRGSLNMIKQGALDKISAEGLGMEDMTKRAMRGKTR